MEKLKRNFTKNSEKDIINKITIKIIIIIIIGILINFLPLPQFYFSQKGNFLNIIFAKYSWLWTIISIVIIFLSSDQYKNKNLIKRIIKIILIGSLIWFSICHLFFPFINSNFGMDLSGHSFLLLFAISILNFEISFSNNFFIVCFFLF